MAIQVIRTRLKLRKDGSEHPLVVNRRTMPFDDLIAAMSEATAIPRSDMFSVWEQEVNAITAGLREGYRVKTPLGTFALGVRGGVKTADGPVPIDSSGLHLIFHADKSLMEKLQRTTKIRVVEKKALLGPLVAAVTNPGNANKTDSAFAGKVANITGVRLRFDPSDEECGVFFRNTAGVSVRAPVYTHLGTANVDAEVPDSLPPGEYAVEVRTRPSGRDLRIGVYGKTVNVEKG